MAGARRLRPDTLSGTIARFVCGARFEDLPAALVEKCRLAILDTLGVTLAGAAEPVTGSLSAYLAALGGSAATVVGTPLTASVQGAAFANAVLGHILDLDDTTLLFYGHPSVVVVPAVLALAEARRLSGADVVRAYAIGTEVQWRVGEAIVANGDHYHLGWHATGTIGPLGAAAACAALLGLDEAATATAISLAASEAGGFQAQFGSDAKALQAGRPAEAGVRAALLAAAGFSAAADALENPQGLLPLTTTRWEPAKVTFDGTWGLVRPEAKFGLVTKNHPVCGSGMGVIEAVQALTAARSVDHRRVVGVTCRIRRNGLGVLRHRMPETALQAKFSMEFWVAAALVFGRLSLDELSDAALSDPGVRRLMAATEVAEDDTVDLVIRGVQIALRLDDGETIDVACGPPLGSPTNPMSADAYVAKFLDCARRGGLGRDTAERVVATVLALDGMPDVAALMPLLRAPEGHAPC